VPEPARLFATRWQPNGGWADVCAALDRTSLGLLPAGLQLVELQLGHHEHDVQHRLAEVGRRVDALLRGGEDLARPPIRETRM
jgi:hypothetical protein